MPTTFVTTNHPAFLRHGSQRERLAFDRHLDGTAVVIPPQFLGE